jgi:translation elongation factor EF-Tu-like GTPase
VNSSEKPSWFKDFRITETLVASASTGITSFCSRIYGQRRSKRCTEILIKELEIPKREIGDKKFTMLADHCFKIKGKGTILTGTVIEGRIKIGD